MKKLMLLTLISASGSMEADLFNPYSYAMNCCKLDNVFYTEVFGGGNFLQTTPYGNVDSKYKPGYTVSGSFGYLWRYGLQIEGEYSFRRNNLNKIRLFGRNFRINGPCSSSSYMLNLLWSPPLWQWGCRLWNIHPFIGGGVGYDHQQMRADSETVHDNNHKNGFAWQILAGLAYPFNSSLDLSLDYKFHQGPLKHLINHSLGLGLTYKFNRFL
jgi:opacity protein-like surface antigen